MTSARRDRSSSQPLVTPLPRPDTARTIRQRRCFSCSRHAPAEESERTACAVIVAAGPCGNNSSSDDALRVEKSRLLSAKLTAITEKTAHHRGRTSGAPPVPITREVLQQMEEPLPVEKDLHIVRWIRATEALRSSPNKNGLSFLPHLCQPAIVEKS